MNLFFSDPAMGPEKKNGSLRLEVRPAISVSRRCSGWSAEHDTDTTSAAMPSLRSSRPETGTASPPSPPATTANGDDVNTTVATATPNTTPKTAYVNVRLRDEIP